MNDFSDSHHLGQTICHPITFFPDRFAKTKTEAQLTWPEFVRHVQDCPAYDTKEQAPFIKLATFSGKPSDRGCLRHNDAVVSVSGLEGDYDAEQMSIGEAADLLRQAGIKSILYASANNHRLDRQTWHFTGPRWRVLVPFSQNMAPERRRSYMAKLNHVLGGVLGKESFNLSQSYYLGKVFGGYWQCEVVDGDYIDDLDVIHGLAEQYPDTQSETPSFGNVELIDPSTKAGAVGYFCRAFTAAQAIERFLPELFVRQTERRYDWVGHDPGGLWLHDDGQHFGGCHDSWPFGTNRLANTFDLVRQFRFDPQCQEPTDTPPHKRPSYQAMLQWMQTLPEVAALGFDLNATVEPLNVATFEDLTAKGVLLPEPGPTTAPHSAPVTLPDGGVVPFPGIMHDLVQATVASAPREQPVLAVGAALVGMASACPGFYRLADGTRLNLYLLGVSPSATGKDMPRTVAEQLAHLVNARVIGGSMTGQGLEDSLPEQEVPTEALLLAVDEVGHWLSNQTETNAKSEYKALAANLLKLFSASANAFVGRTLANKPTKLFKNPTVSVLGFSTPGALAQNVSFKNVADGLLGRMLVLKGQTTVRSKRVRNAFEMPKTVRERAADINTMRVCDPQTLAQGIVVRTDTAGEAALDTVHGFFEDMQDDNEMSSTLCRRSFEKVQRVAGVLAVWDCPSAPVITPEHVYWARDFVRLSNATITDFAGQEMMSNDPLEHVVKVQMVCQKILSGEIKATRMADIKLVQRGVVPRTLALARSRLPVKEFNQAVKHLGDEGWLEEQWVQTNRKPRGFLALLTGDEE